MQKKYADKGVALLALSAESSSKVKPFVEKNKINYVVASDATTAKNKYGIRGWPTYFVVDPSGKVTHVGHSSKNAELEVQKLLKQHPNIAKGPLGGAAVKKAYLRARKYHKKQDWVRALKAYIIVTREYPGTPYAEKAESHIKKIKADPEIMAGVRASEMRRKCESWLDTAQTLLTMGKKNEAAAYYQRVINRYPESDYAKMARDAMASL